MFVIDYKGKNKKHLSLKNGYNDVDFSANSQYYINYNTTANTPYFITLNNANGTVIDTLVDNKKLNSTLASYAISPKKFINFTTKSNVNLNAWMITPPDFDSTKTYPLFMTVYNGPGHNTVTNQWEGSTALWHQYLAQQGYIVVSVDGRGTMFRGEEFKKCTYLQLGKLETIDQIEAAIYLGNLPYIDANRIGIQGWSYGGYMSSLCITKGADVFKTAIAVAPVTNWRYYDSVYTERFMRTPEENEDGYDDNSPINHVEKLKGNYLLIHGSGDDNVHIQNSMEMIKKLVENNKQFEYMVYPNKNHSIYGGTTRLHLFTKMSDFILKTL